eukprot:40446_1
MSTEIVAAIKAINNHVTAKYGDQVLVHLTQTSNAHLLFQRQFFTELDQAVQKLVNNVTALVAQNMSLELLDTIQSHCNNYNKWKKTKYDSHLFKIRSLEQRSIGVIRTVFKQKLAEQDRLFAIALSAPPANTPNISTFPSNTTNNTVCPATANNTVYPPNGNPLQPHSIQNFQMTQNISRLNTINEFLSIINQNPPSKPSASTNAPMNNMQIKPETNTNIQTDINPNDGNINSSSQPTPPAAKYNNRGTKVEKKFNAKSAPIRILGATLPSNTDLDVKPKVGHASNHSNSKHLSKAITAPPKPPPPETSENGSGEYYQCTLCHQQFKDESKWKMHRETHPYAMRKNIIKKGNRKRTFSHVDAFDAVAISHDHQHKANKRRKIKLKTKQK